MFECCCSVHPIERLGISYGMSYCGRTDLMNLDRLLIFTTWQVDQYRISRWHSFNALKYNLSESKWKKRRKYQENIGQGERHEWKTSWKRAESKEQVKPCDKSGWKCAEIDNLTRSTVEEIEL